MPYNPEQTLHYTDHSHPLFQALRQMAAFGQEPSADEYNAIPGYVGHATQIRTAVKRAQALHREGDHGKADAYATEKLHEIGALTAHLPMPEPTGAGPEDSDEIAARMFRTGH